MLHLVTGPLHLAPSRMLESRAIDRVLVLLEAAAAAALLVRFVVTGLYRKYPFFFGYLAVVCFQGVVPLFIRNGTNTYGIVYLVTEFVVICLYALIVLELYSLVLRDLAGIAGLARRYIRIALGVAIVVSVLLLTIEETPKGYIGAFFTFERPIVTSLVLFVLLITAFLVRYPVPLNRNVIYYTVGYAFYFTAKASALFLRNTGHATWDRYFSLALLAVSDACLLFWIFALNRSGEANTVVLGPPSRREDEEHLLRQLEAINASLLRARENSSASDPQ